MATAITTERIGNRFILRSPYHSIEFDYRLAEKKYPFAIGIYNAKYNANTIIEIESSKIVKVDAELSYYSQPSHASTLYLLPQSMFDTQKFTDVLYNLLQVLGREHEYD